MLLIPAIDLKDGHCVRLKQGDMDQSTIFSEDPAAMARAFAGNGSKYSRMPFCGEGTPVSNAARANGPIGCGVTACA